MANRKTLEEERRTPRGAAVKGATILVVDDNPSVLQMLSDYLDETYNIVAVGSGEKALETLKSRQIDIALVDIKLQGMDGLETIARLTEIDHDIVTILITGFPTIDSSVKAIRLGASDYILKPFKHDEVKRSVETAIKERETRREMKNLQERIRQLEKGISDKKGTIKVNLKLGGG